MLDMKTVGRNIKNDRTEKNIVNKIIEMNTKELVPLAPLSILQK